MSFAFHLLIALLAALPVLLMFDGSLGQDLVTLVAAIVLLKALTSAPNEIATTARLLGPLSVALALPAGWMLLQVVPVPFSLANPIWSSAAVALNDASLSGSVSLDPGATLRSVMLYGTLVALMISTIIVTQDRQSAATALFVLCVVTAVVSAEILLNRRSEGTATTAYLAISIAGVLLHASAAILLLGRHTRRRDQAASSFGDIVLQLGLCAVGAAICIFAVVSVASTDALTAVIFGLAVLLTIVLVRRSGIRSWSLGILLAIAASIVIGVGLVRLQHNAAETYLAFSPSSSFAVLSRIMADFKWFGTGVGTLGPVTQIYMDYGTEPIANSSSTMIIVALEWGRIALFAMACIALQLFIYLFRGALQRGRDYYFSAVAASIVIALGFEAFADASLTHFTVQVILAITMGLGIAQSIGRTNT